MSNPYLEKYRGLFSRKFLEVSLHHITREDWKLLEKAVCGSIESPLAYEIMDHGFLVHVNHFDEGELERIRENGFSEWFVNLVEAALESDASFIIFEVESIPSEEFPIVRAENPDD